MEKYLAGKKTAGKIPSGENTLRGKDRREKNLARRNPRGKHERSKYHSPVLQVMYGVLKFISEFSEFVFNIQMRWKILVRKLFSEKLVNIHLK